MRTAVFTCLLLALLPRISPVTADGGIVAYEDGLWKMLGEQGQLCFIHHSNGVQRMVLSVEAKGKIDAERVVWVFPVPADPDDVELDIVREMPPIGQRTIQADLLGDICLWFSLLSLTQARPLAFLYLGFESSGDDSGGPAGGASPEGESDRFVIHQSITREGLTTELVSVADSRAIRSYLAGSGLALPETLYGILGEYVGSEYSFVFSWVSDSAEHDNSYLGVAVSFPSSRAYFPLRPTAAYGEEIIPIVVYLSDYRAPMLSSDIESYTEVEYLTANPASFIDQLAGLVGADDRTGDDFAATVVKIQAPARKLSSDLWFEDEPPAWVRLLVKAERQKHLYLIPLTMLLMPAAGLAAALLTFGRREHHLHKFALLSLANVLSLVTFWVLAFRIHADRAFRKPEAPAGKSEDRADRAVNRMTLQIIALCLPVVCGFCLIVIESSGLVNIIGFLLITSCIPFIPSYAYGSRKKKSRLIYCSLYSVLYMDMLLLSLAGISWYLGGLGS